MFGGEGIAFMREIFSKGEYHGQARLMAVLTLHPGCSVGEHTHQNDEELIFILSGCCDYLDNTNWTTLQAGDAALTCGGETHKIVNSSNDDVTYLAIVLTYAS